MKTRYTTASDEECYFVRDCLSGEQHGPYANYKSAQQAAQTMNREWLDECQEAKDTLFRAGAFSATDNQRLQRKLDTAKREPWAMKGSWGHGQNKKARGA